MASLLLDGFLQNYLVRFAYATQLKGDSMKNHFRLSLLIIIFCGMFSACTSQQGDKIVIKGSTTMAPLLERLAADYRGHSQDLIVIESVGSMNGINSLLQKECEIASSSAPISAEIIQRGKKNDVHFQSFTLCIDRIIPVVNTSNPVRKISRNQLKGIFTGKISNWASVGGSNATIQIVLRHPESGTYQIWQQSVLDGIPYAKNFAEVASNSGVLAIVAENKHDIGYISKAYINHEVRELVLSDHGKDELVERRLILYADKNRLSKSIKSFFSYLHSNPAKQIIISNGFSLAR